MTNKNEPIVELPPHLRNRIPSQELLREALSRELADPDTSAQLFRAAYVPESVLPVRVQRVYRFGPPPELFRPDGTPPFWWLYAAHAAETAIWEAQFCKNDVTRTGTFYFDTFAVQHGVIAELKFPRPPRLWNLNGSASSRLGIYDDLSSPDYEWSQWFGYQLDRTIQSVDPVTRPDGFVYGDSRDVAEKYGAGLVGA
ncbi:RES domain-containing protein [Paraburkholderia phymatum]